MTDFLWIICGWRCLYTAIRNATKFILVVQYLTFNTYPVSTTPQIKHFKHKYSSVNYTFRGIKENRFSLQPVSYVFNVFYMMKKIYSSTPMKSVKAEEGPSEKKLAYYGVLLALCIITTKLYFINEEIIKRFIFETKLVTYEQIVTDGEIMLTYAWKTSIRYSRYWLSLLCGGLVTYFTWLMVYLDSKDPGKVPPSPFSPKQKYSYLPVFHLNYAFGLLIGILVTSFCYIKGFSIEY